MRLKGSDGKPDLLWKEYFRDLSLWCSTKKKSGFIHRTNCKSPWIDEGESPCWVREELRRRIYDGVERSIIGRDHHIEDCFYFMASLKECGKCKDLGKGTRIHDKIVDEGLLRKNPYLARSLISMYAKCGLVGKAQKVVDEVLDQDMVSWSIVMAGYTKQGEGHQALKCFEAMVSKGSSPDAITYSCVLKACGAVGAISEGERIHCEIVARGFLKKDVVLGNALIDMYVKCGRIEKAQQVLDDLPSRNVVSWSSVIFGYADRGKAYEAFRCFERMQGEGLSPDAISFICILKACGKVQDLEKGSEIHDEIVRRKLLDDNIELGNALVAMYVKCRVLTRARLVLEELVLRNTISWNVLISGYTQQGQSHEALSCLEQMQSEGIAPDAVTFICTMKACGKTGAIDRGKQIHTEIISRGLLKKDVELGNALVDMYCKCGKLEKAQEVLKELPVRDIVSWNTLIAGFVSQGQSCEAMNCFKQMQNDGLSPDAVTILCILKACSSSGAVSEGKLIHDEFINKDLLENNAAIGAALVDMYAKCGMLDKAQELLEELPIRNMVLWSVLIARYAEEKRGYEALQCFEQMQSEGFAPDRVALLSVLHACSSSGLLDEAQTLFGNMTKIYGLSPSSDHHTCMVVMLGSIGNFEKAMEVIKAMPSLDFIDIWLALLGACEKWGNVKLGILAFDQVIQIDRACAGAYVLMASIFGATGMQKDAEMVEAMRVKYVDWEANG